MLRILTPWDSQPQEPVELDRDLGSTVLGAWLPGQGNIALFPRSGGRLNSAGVSPSFANDGRVYQTENNTAERWELDSTSSWVPTSGGWSLVLRVQFGASFGTGQGFGIRTNGGAAAKIAAFVFTSGNVFFDFGGFGSGTTRLTTTTSTTNGTSATFVGTTGPRGMEIWRDGVLIASNAANPSRTADAAMAFALGDLYGGTAGQARYGVAAAIGAQLPPGLARKYSENWLTLFAPRSIWVPVSVGGGSASSITAAAGASTASTLAASSTAASTPTAAAGTATASTVAATSTAASAITSATGAATASTLTGSAVVAGAITAAAGVGTGGTLVGDTLAAGSAAIVAADGVATTATLGGSSVAAAAIGVAEGAATAATVSGYDITPVVPDVTSVGRRRKTRAQRLQDYDVPMPVEVLTSTVPSDKVIEPIAAPKVEPVPAKASKLAKPKPKKPDAPAPEVKAKAKSPTPKKPAAQVQAPEPVKAVAASRPMMLSDILSAETMTPKEMVAAVKLLARIQLGPQLIRSTPKAKLIRA